MLFANEKDHEGVVRRGRPFVHQAVSLFEVESNLTGRLHRRPIEL